MSMMYAYWGKADGNASGHHLLVYHALDVAAVAAVPVAFSGKMGVPVKPKSCALGKYSRMALWFSPNWER